MTKVPSEILEHVEVTEELRYIDLGQGEAGPSRRDTWTKAIERIHSSLAQDDGTMATRVTVHNLGSLDWGRITSQVKTPA